MKTEKKIQSNIFDFIEINVSCDDLIIDKALEVYRQKEERMAKPLVSYRRYRRQG